MDVKEMLEKIIERGKQEDMYKLNDMLDELICELKEEKHELYEHYKMCLYEMAYGGKIDENVAEKWVKSMQPIGMHWIMSETTDAMKQLDYDCDKISFFVAANMIYNDYYNAVKEDESLALKMAYDFLNDEDAVDNKLFKYYKYIVRKD